MGEVHQCIRIHAVCNMYPLTRCADPKWTNAPLTSSRLTTQTGVICMSSAPATVGVSMNAPSTAERSGIFVRLWFRSHFPPFLSCHCRYHPFFVSHSNTAMAQSCSLSSSSAADVVGQAYGQKISKARGGPIDEIWALRSQGFERAMVCMYFSLLYDQLSFSVSRQ